MLTLQEEERRDIARDLHDEISPCLFAVNVDLASISRLADQGRGAEITAEIQSTMEAVSHMQRQIRTMLGRLRSGVLTDFGLATAMTSVVFLAPPASGDPLHGESSAGGGKLRRLA